jgi:pyridoxamine 5'-phosphate oxidase-like protein
MYETPAEMDDLQALLDHSITQASPFLRASFEMPEHSLSAAQLIAHLQGSLTVALATSTARSEPRVAPIGAFFVRAAFYVPTVAESARARHLARRPVASLTYFEGIDVAVIAHGQMRIMGHDDPAFAELDRAWIEGGRESPTQWTGSAVYLRMEPATLYTYARYPERIGAR